MSLDPIPKLIPELDVSDIQKSLKFYVDVLGFTIRYQRPEEQFAYLEREGAHLMLEAAGGNGRRFTTASLEKPYGRGMNLQIKVSTITTVANAIHKAGYSLVIPLEDKWYKVDDGHVGNRQLVVADPDGYLLRLFEDLGAKT